MKTIDEYKGDPFLHRDLKYLAEDSNFNGRFVARALQAEEETFGFELRASYAEAETDRIFNEVKDALDKGSFRGMPLRDKEFDYPIVDPIKWTNITLKRYRAMPEYDGADMYRIQVLISKHEAEMLGGEQIRRAVLDRFTSMFHSHVAKLLKETQ